MKVKQFGEHTGEIVLMISFGEQVISADDQNIVKAWNADTLGECRFICLEHVKII